MKTFVIVTEKDRGKAEKAMKAFTGDKQSTLFDKNTEMFKADGKKISHRVVAWPMTERYRERVAAALEKAKVEFFIVNSMNEFQQIIKC